MKFLYCVARNGLCPVRKYEVIKETPKTYVINSGLSARILKSTMSNKFCVFFEDEKSAQEYYNKIKYIPNKHDKPKTKFDSIKDMNVKEMAEFLVNVRKDCVCDYYRCIEHKEKCIPCIEQYLKREVSKE